MPSERNPALTGQAVRLVHLEDPSGSGLAACCGKPFENPPDGAREPIVACSLCVSPRRSSPPPPPQPAVLCGDPDDPEIQAKAHALAQTSDAGVLILPPGSFSASAGVIDLADAHHLRGGQ